MNLKEITLNPMLPIWAMAIICVVLLCFKRKGVIPYIRQIIVVILLFVINLRPMVPDENIKVEKQKLDSYVILVVDDTISMLAEDYTGGATRMSAVKNDLCYIVDELNGSKFAVIGFNNNSSIMAPYTDDTYFVKNLINQLYPLPAVNATGTNISVCRSSIASCINDAQLMSDGHISVIFVSDGENTDNNTLRSFAEIGENVELGAVLGYGTRTGGQMHYALDEDGEEGLIMDGSSPAVSKIDEDNLQQVAEDLGVPYVHMENMHSADSVIRDMRAVFEADPEEEMKIGYTDIYFYFVIPIAVLVAYEFISVKRKG